MLIESFFYHIFELTDRITSFITKQKTLFIIILVIITLLGGFIALMVKLRGNVLAQMHMNTKSVPEDIYVATKSGISISDLPVPSPPDDTNLNTAQNLISNKVENIYIPPDTSTPYPTPTNYPIPTTYQTTTSSAPSTPSCAGTPKWYNSEAIISATTSLINQTATIEIQLLDCNNNFAPVNDTLSVTTSNVDSGTKINGSSPPVTVTAQNGKATISVTSSNAVTDTYIITDTTRGFTVTDPHNNNPSIQFANNTLGNSHCTTADGVPNTWYSNVYPNPPITTINGTVTLVVDIKDCGRNLAPVSDTITISLSSGDSNTQINGHTLPTTVTTQNGEATFSVTSSVIGNVTLNVQDSTSGFSVTDPNNNNPTIQFNAAPSTPTPAPQDSSTPTPTFTPTPTAATSSGTGG